MNDPPEQVNEEVSKLNESAAKESTRAASAKNTPAIRPSLSIASVSQAHCGAG
jgi:hypothetical protein